MKLSLLLKQVRACQLCAARLPLGPRPVLRASTTAKILIVGQAPGLKVHQTGIPWNDPSGDRLRLWLGLDKTTFYDESRIAIIPAGFCYPGRNSRGGDLPPRPECARVWLPLLLQHLQNVQIKILAGKFAHRLYIEEAKTCSLTELVKAWRRYLPDLFVLPHPSFRNIRWFRQNPWFKEEVLPVLRQRVHELMYE